MNDQAVAELLAREAIRDLPVRYCDCVWRDDIAGLVDLFASDGTFTAVMDGRETSASGQDDLLKLFTGGLAIAPRPYIHNHVVTLTGSDTAEGRCYLALHSAKQNLDFIGAGWYDDAYCVENGEWRFRSRRFTALRIDDLPPGFDND